MAALMFTKLLQMSNGIYCPRAFVVRALRVSGINCFSTENSESPDPERLFIRHDVQSLLMRVTGFDFSRIFKKRFTDSQNPKYELLTNEELEKIQAETLQRGKEKLQMPPVMNPRKIEESVIATDPEIEGHDSCKYVFTDITYGLPDKTRVIVVREPCGKLRHATGDERDRLLHAYFPRPNRTYTTPQMFTEQRLEELLQAGKYEQVLDRACIQFEPDDNNFIRVTHRVYEYVADRKEYDRFRSTRYFGPMALYFACLNRMEGLLVDMLQQELFSDAADMIELHNIIFPHTKSAKLRQQNTDLPPENFIKEFAEHDSSEGSLVQLALQAYLESRQSSQSQAG